jgi:hypothetical protein
MDVEVPVNGCVIVQSGEVHDAREFAPRWALCWCIDGAHAPVHRGGELRLGPASEPHSVGFQQFEIAWEVNK